MCISLGFINLIPSIRMEVIMKAHARLEFSQELRCMDESWLSYVACMAQILGASGAQGCHD